MVHRKNEYRLFEKTKPIWKQAKLTQSLNWKGFMIIYRSAGHEKTKPIQSLSWAQSNGPICRPSTGNLCLRYPKHQTLNPKQNRRVPSSRSQWFQVGDRNSDVCFRTSDICSLISAGKMPVNWSDYGKFEQKNVASFGPFGYNMV